MHQFSHFIDSMFNQLAKWLAMSKEVSWRTPVSSLNLLIISTVWHQTRGFLGVVVSKSQMYHKQL